jgi:hypothetical protein
MFPGGRLGEKGGALRALEVALLIYIIGRHLYGWRIDWKYIRLATAQDGVIMMTDVKELEYSSRWACQQEMNHGLQVEK